MRVRDSQRGRHCCVRRVTLGCIYIYIIFVYVYIIFVYIYIIFVYIYILYSCTVALSASTECTLYLFTFGVNIYVHKRAWVCIRRALSCERARFRDRRPLGVPSSPTRPRVYGVNDAHRSSRDAS